MDSRFKRRYFLLVVFLTYYLIGCASEGTRAPISHVGEHPTNLGPSSPPPVSSSYPLASPQVRAESPTVATSQLKPRPTDANDGGTSVQQGRIVYNRSYETIPKGSHYSDSWQVKHGDTLFYIAWVTGNDFRDLAQRNHISAPYALSPGQILKTKNSAGRPLAEENAITAVDERRGSPPATAGPTQIINSSVARQPVITYSEHSETSYDNRSKQKLLASKKSENRVTPANNVADSALDSSDIVSKGVFKDWYWPSTGKIIDGFSGAEGANKGIDIAGSRGQPIVATAAGHVVYAGNALRGYGNLIIIKHNDDYLSAYAHNDTMLVREQQQIKAGQKIATMGSTGTSSVRLHFEIRYKGKSVNPLRYLKQR